MAQPLTSKDELTRLVQNRGINSWEDLLDGIKNIPYGRTSNRSDFSLVLKEGKGTCSSKHALLKILADINQVHNVTLILGMFKMTSLNTPKVKTVLEKYRLPFMLEAHCYLKINGQGSDFTAPNFNFKSIKEDILEELEIEPHQAGDYKVEFHKDYARKWLECNVLPYNFDEFWAIREECIEALAN